MFSVTFLLEKKYIYFTLQRTLSVSPFHSCSSPPFLNAPWFSFIYFGCRANITKPQILTRKWWKVTCLRFVSLDCWKSKTSLQHFTKVTLTPHFGVMGEGSWNQSTIDTKRQQYMMRMSSYRKHHEWKPQTNK
jgi:hypothetical protein